MFTARRCIPILIVLIVLAACTPPARVIIVPTLAQLPTATAVSTETATLTLIPSETHTLTMTATSTATFTPTPLTPTLTATVPRDLELEAARAQMTALNATLGAYMTATPTLLPSATPTSPPSVIEMSPQFFAVRGTGSLRDCPHRACREIAVLPADTQVQVNALVYGEDVDFGNAVWYRVEWQNGIGYVYSAVVVPVAPVLATSTSLPTLPPATGPQSQPIPNLQNVNPALCPSAEAMCSTLTTCEQAMACLAAGITRLDRDRDGIPCEALCAP
ncbi:MAG: excalibur calcium-binding domain-containing protein [bacterium]|nr:excalibur calcium-binding domain-containing protein [bacterium]